MFKGIVILAFVSVSIVGCASYQYGDFAKAEESEVSGIAGDTARRLAEIYPPGTTAFHVSTDEVKVKNFGRLLDTALRTLGFAVAPSPGDGVEQLRWVFDEVGDRRYRVSVWVDDAVTSRVYERDMPVGAWAMNGSVSIEPTSIFSAASDLGKPDEQSKQTEPAQEAVRGKPDENKKVPSVRDLYIPFPPGKTSIADVDGEWRAEIAALFVDYRRLLETGAENKLLITGLSQSDSNHAKWDLAQARADSVKQYLVDLGVSPKLVMTDAVFRNNANESQQGAFAVVVPDAERLVSQLAVFEEKAEAEEGPKERESDKQDENVVYALREGETLEESLTRWVSQSGYKRLIWNVKDRENRKLAIPIRADAGFNCDLIECLQALKTSYATTAKPIHLDIQVRTGNKTVYVELMRYDG